MEEVTLILSYQGYKECTGFEVCDLGKSNLIIGYTWLHKHNPEIDQETIRGTPKFQYSNSVTLCNHPPKKSHQVATPIDHLVHVAFCRSLPHCSPFYFCALLFPSYSISILFHILFPILFVFHILPLSLFHDLLLVAMHSVPYVAPLRLGSPQSFLFGSPLQGMHPSAVLHLSNILWQCLKVWFGPVFQPPRGATVDHNQSKQLP